MKFENKKHLLNYEKMDDLHKEFVDIYNSLEDQTAQSYKNVMIKILEQSKRHFCEEETLMDTFKYPRSREHKDEHKKVLTEIEYFMSKADTKMGQMLIASYYKEKLPSWFDLHLISMDSDLSSFMKTKS